jgi:hypothetical protein
MLSNCRQRLSRIDANACIRDITTVVIIRYISLVKATPTLQRPAQFDLR